MLHVNIMPFTILLRISKGLKHPCGYLLLPCSACAESVHLGNCLDALLLSVMFDIAENSGIFLNFPQTNHSYKGCVCVCECVVWRLLTFWQDRSIHISPFGPFFNLSSHFLLFCKILSSSSSFLLSPPAPPPPLLSSKFLSVLYAFQYSYLLCFLLTHALKASLSPQAPYQGYFPLKHLIKDIFLKKTIPSVQGILMPAESDLFLAHHVNSDKQENPVLNVWLVSTL